MKKIILFLLLLNISRVIVSAETIYGDYYPVLKLDSIISDETKVDTYKIYNTYKIEYEDLGYLEENNEYIKDENDYIYEERTYTEDTNINDEFIVINSSSINNSTNTITIGNFNYNFKIYELEVLYKNNKVDYQIGNIDYFIDKNLNINNINDNDIKTYYLNAIMNSNIKIIFPEYYSLEDITIIIHTETNHVKTKFLMHIDNNPIIYLNKNIDRKHIINFKIDDNNIGLVEYYYKKLIKLYRYKKLKKVPQNIYIKEGENLLLDDYKIVSELYKRDKLVLSDELTITNKNMTISDFIEYSSNEVITDCSINYEINGIYKCNFILNDINILKDIYVDIKNEDDNIIANEKENIETNITPQDSNENIETNIIKFDTEIINNNKISDDLVEVKVQENKKIDKQEKVEKTIKDNPKEEPIKVALNNSLDYKEDNKNITEDNINTSSVINKKNNTKKEKEDLVKKILIEEKTITKEKKYNKETKNNSVFLNSEIQNNKKTNKSIIKHILIKIVLVLFSTLIIVLKKRKRDNVESL